MSLNPFARNRSRVLVAGVAAALALTGALANPADAAKPAGSRATVMLETGDATLNPANAITSGWWGHEGGSNNGTGTGGTFLSMDGSDGAGTVNDASIAAMVAAMGTTDTSNIAYAIVPTTADGSNEAPTVTGTQNAAQVFNPTSGLHPHDGWIMLPSQGLGSSMNGINAANDSVMTMSTFQQVTDWIAAGQPVQQYDNSLVLHDSNAPGNPVSTHPKGTSILDTWPAGTALSLVAFVTNGNDPTLGNQVPIVAVGGDGKAETAWLPFTTVGKPGDALRTSAGYQVVGAYKPTVTVTHSFSGTTATLTATVKNKLNATATDATGTMNFALYSGGSDGTPTPVAVTNGVATLQVPGFTPGTSKTYDVSYAPDGPAQGTYLTSDQTRHTATAPIATTTSLTITGSTSHTFTAKVSPAVAGSVTFKNGSSVLGSATVSGGSAHIVKSLSAGKHVIQAIFNPSSATYASSSATKTVYQATVTATLKPTKGRRGTRPTVTVKIVATGATVGGKVTIVFDPPSGPTKKFTVTVSHGVATFKLPKSVRGSTKVTAMYLGSGAVLAANSKTVIFKAT